jgi:dihydroorotate dehydrogenase subfamily 2
VGQAACLPRQYPAKLGMKHKIFKIIYKNFLKPILFLFDAEFIHNRFLLLGNLLGKNKAGRNIIRSLFYYSNKKLVKEIDGITFSNPVGLAAGFDYNGDLAEIMHDVGFGFNSVGTVTAKPYEGNQKPRLSRLPKSKSLLVNKGFKSLGADAIYKKISKMNLTNLVVGVSVGSSNLCEVNTIKKAISDYIYTFNKFKSLNSIKYFELNISCPNTKFKEPFSNTKNFKLLINQIKKLKINKPIYVKMPNEKSIKEILELSQLIYENKLQGVILSNLVKSRKNKYLNKKELKEIKHLKGNFSGLPTKENSTKLIKEVKKNFGNKLTIIGVGGVMSYDDAREKFDAGADLIQLITGMIYEGPQLVAQINKKLC